MFELESMRAQITGPAGYVVIAVLGLLWGSFANVCIYRMPPTSKHPQGLSVVRPGSRCGSCQRSIAWFDNVPVLSFLWLRGRCRHCGAAFSPRYLLVEVATAMLWLALYHYVFAIGFVDDNVADQLLRWCILAAFCFVLVVVTFIDLDHRLILDKITFPSILLFYVAGLWFPERSWFDGLIGIAVGYGIVRAIADGYYYATGREGMGYGDGKLLAVVGALLGWKAVVVTLFAGSLLGSVIGIGLLLAVRWKNAGVHDPAIETPLRHTEVPFGPFLCAGALLFVFLEPWLQVRFTVLW